MIKKMTAGTFGLTESVIKNDSSERLVLEAGEAIEFTDPETKYCKITFRGSGENAGGYININKYYPVLAGSTAVMELTTPVRLEVELVISAESTLKFDEIEIEELSQPYSNRRSSRCGCRSRNMALCQFTGQTQSDVRHRYCQ